MKSWHWIMRLLFENRRRTSPDARLRRVIAADHVNEKRGQPVPLRSFSGWWYLSEARRAAHAAA